LAVAAAVDSVLGKIEVEEPSCCIGVGSLAAVDVANVFSTTAVGSALLLEDVNSSGSGVGDRLSMKVDIGFDVCGDCAG